MNDAVIYIVAVGFALAIFPMHIFNYIYINTEERYASINITFFRYIRLFNINTVKNKPDEIEFNGKPKKTNLATINYYKIINQLCIQKVIQLSDFGIKNNGNCYTALMQHAFATAIYKFLQVNGNSAKLRNYIVLNEEHSTVRYYSKMVTVINLYVASKIILIILAEKIHEHKIKKGKG